MGLGVELGLGVDPCTLTEAQPHAAGVSKGETLGVHLPRLCGLGERGRRRWPPTRTPRQQGRGRGLGGRGVVYPQLPLSAVAIGWDSHPLAGHWILAPRNECTHHWGHDVPRCDLHHPLSVRAHATADRLKSVCGLRDLPSLQFLLRHNHDFDPEVCQVGYFYLREGSLAPPGVAHAQGRCSLLGLKRGTLPPAGPRVLKIGPLAGPAQPPPVEGSVTSPS